MYISRGLVLVPNCLLDSTGMVGIDTVMAVFQDGWSDYCREVQSRTYMNQPRVMWPNMWMM